MVRLPKPVRRAWKRTRAAARDGVVHGSPQWLRDKIGPAGSYFDMLVIDLGMFRLLFDNRHRVADGVWRSAQPAPSQIRRFARHGIRTIVNLRGEFASGSYWLERRACADLGIKFIDFRIRSRDAPSREELRAARNLFDTVEYPMLMHCKSGADRAGLMSALYRHLKLGEPIEIAKEQLSLRFGHIRQADTGVLDYFFDQYLSDTAKTPMPFFDWVEKVYDPDELRRTYRSKGWANKIVHGILRRE